MKNKKTPEKKPTLVAFLLDRSGSMQSCKQETIGIDVVHNADKVEKVKDLTEKTYEPRAGTPLYDAAGKTIRAIEKQAGDKYKVLFVILTDGQENSSVEWNDKTTRELIKEKEDKCGWTFAYVGVGLQGFQAATHMAHGTRSMNNVMRTSHQNTGRAYAKLSGATVSFMATAGGQTVKDFYGTSNATTEDETK